ncbi:MAG: tRNA pseudouridine(55) synthase TruB [Firmicutes bacterium]|nr:tRNA pseudouridine(55) synthase TruB [Bacillota bacterium]
MTGILVLLKPLGMTSHDVVAKVRRHLGQRRVGHTGTLDPEAAGVLVLCLGNATRLVPYMEGHLKGYRGELWLGRSTDTQDACGEVLDEDRTFSITDMDLRGAFAAFRGEIEQIPPMVSALKYKGKRLYELARQGKVVERKPRPVKIYELSLVEGPQKNRWEFGDVVQFDVVCSKGTYIRTLCQDIGSYLGVPAHMSSLLRTQVGPWSLDDVFTLEEFRQITKDRARSELLDMGANNRRGFFSMDWGIKHLPGAVISRQAVRYLRHGRRIQASQVVQVLEAEDTPAETVTDTQKSRELLRIYDIDGRFLGLCRLEKAEREWELQPIRVLSLESDE